MKTHGLSGTPEYGAWVNMHHRCSDSDHPKYRHYGGRGIEVCKRWHDFTNFLTDMGPRPSSAHSLDRYPDNDGNYCKRNCRWATRSEQNRNTRLNRHLVYRDHILSLHQWRYATGISCNAISKRIRRGWPIACVLTTPLGGAVRRRSIEGRFI
jgi:hypothetical protein